MASMPCLREQIQGSLGAMLIDSATRGHVDMLTMAIEAGANVNFDTHDACMCNISPLLTAASHGHHECVRVLIAHGADVNFRNKPNNTPVLHNAVDKGHLLCVRHLLNAADINLNLLSGQGSTAVGYAASRNQPAMLRALIDKGANVDLHTPSISRSPLHYAAAFGHGDCVRILLQAGADMNVRNRDNQTALETANGYGHTHIADMFFKAEIDRMTVTERINNARRHGVKFVNIRLAERVCSMSKLTLSSGKHHDSTQSTNQIIATVPNKQATKRKAHKQKRKQQGETNRDEEDGPISSTNAFQDSSATRNDRKQTNDDGKLRCQYCATEQDTKYLCPNCERDDCGHSPSRFYFGHWMTGSSPCHFCSTECLTIAYLDF